MSRRAPGAWNRNHWSPPGMPANVKAQSTNTRPTKALDRINVCLQSNSRSLLARCLLLLPFLPHRPILPSRFFHPPLEEGVDDDFLQQGESVSEINRMRWRKKAEYRERRRERGRKGKSEGERDRLSGKKEATQSKAKLVGAALRNATGQVCCARVMLRGGGVPPTSP